MRESLSKLTKNFQKIEQFSMIFSLFFLYQRLFFDKRTDYFNFAEVSVNLPKIFNMDDFLFK